ncbi:MAG: response regulator transcription factor [Candidatus Obscuribacterales bacterium]|nr:response regulator transcription factor [Candidatus Obscuribacterales bacterium]
MAKVLIVEDDRQLSTLLVDSLTAQGYQPETVYKGAEGLERLRFYKYDVIILDWELPEMSGPEIAKQFRDGGGVTPILMLTGKREIEEKEQGLDAGADDYLTKPFHLKELAARLRALLRRPAAVNKTELRVGDITLRPGSAQAFKGDEELKLQPRELALLEFFMRHPNQPFSAEAILDRVWSSESDASSDQVRIQVMRLRKKIDDEGKESLIKTAHRVGYMMVPPAE